MKRLSKLLTNCTIKLPVNTKYIATFEANHFFHIIAKAAGNNLLFHTDENRRFFLRKYLYCSSGYFDTYSYVLMDNHAHWLVKCNSHEGLTAHLSEISADFLKTHQKKFIKNEISFEAALEFQCKDFFISYAMAYNKENKRQGGLFVNPFRRIKVADDAHFTQLIIYHHANVLKHLGQKNFQDYPWSSYQSFLSDKPTHLKREEVLEWFGGKEAFIKTHQENSAHYYAHPFSLE
jgi:putative transposase